jgi:hypothetical protein
MNGFDRLFARSGLSLDRLRTFLAVAAAGNPARAAKGDPTRQAQFSRQVNELEGFSLLKGSRSNNWKSGIRLDRRPCRVIVAAS